MLLNLNSPFLFYILETIGILSFFISGAMLAKKKDFDPIGVYIIGFVTAFGGGTIRDVLLDNHPLYWIQHSEYPLIFFLLAAIVYYFDMSLKDSRLLIPDALGIATFGITSTQLALHSDLPLVIVPIIAVVSACFGGVLRDLLCTQTPFIFQKESFYAMVVFLGSVFYLALKFVSVNTHLNAAICFVAMVLFRLLAMKYSWRFR